MSGKNKKNKFLAAISSDPPRRAARLQANSSKASDNVVEGSHGSDATSSPAATVSESLASLLAPSTPTTTSPSAPAPKPAPKRAEKTTEAKLQQAEALRFKKEFLSNSRERVETADSFDALAGVFGDVLKWLQSNSAITQEFWKVLSTIQERLANHVTIVRESETTSSFSALLLQTVTPALKQLSEKTEAQHKAIASLCKEVASVKAEKTLSYAAVAAAAAKPQSRLLRLPPNPNRLLFPPRVTNIVSTVNKHLVALSLPALLYAQKQNASSIFLVPESAADTQLLSKAWTRWGPSIFPGARIAPVALHSHIQVNGILFRDVTDMNQLKREFEAQSAAILASGRKPKVAGSVYFLLQSRDKVDLALSRGRVVLCSTSPTVERGFPLLRISQCWGCHKYGHTHARCNIKVPSCAVCAKPVPEHDNPVQCSGPVSCLNCGGKHRADSYACPKCKELITKLATRMKELHESLDKSSVYPLPYMQSDR
ncbi:hypothetical protein R3P38DRAFT_2793033 [Favolaschia claudopus]|uniref:Gag-like protein n=1 Tax=Favolaschia claudopus TaxID=2862362 RepID=A0AAW0AE11_9AGAR